MQIVRSSGPASPSFGIRPVRFVLGIIACVGIALTLFSLLFGYRSIPTNSVGVKLRFGALSGIEDPGLTYVVQHVDELVIVTTVRLLKRLAELCSDYKLGLQIQQVQLATVRPPAVVQAAFNEVNQAQQEKQTAINQAWAVYNDAVPNASGQAKERLKQGEAYAFHRVN